MGLEDKLYPLLRLYEASPQPVKSLVGSAYRIEGIESGVLLRPGTISASIGISSYREMEMPDDCSARERKNEFIRAADQAMYRAKLEGKNRVCFGVYEAQEES